MNNGKGNMVTDWLNQNGNKEIENQVEREIKLINKSEMLKGKIKQYCKYMKIKFVKYCENGFIASYNFPIKAGMECTPYNGKIVSFPIRIIGQKTINRKFLIYKDGDIVDDGIYITQ
jgi:hypothetical protein